VAAGSSQKVGILLRLTSFIFWTSDERIDYTRRIIDEKDKELMMETSFTAKLTTY
jgi:hypothetical protein